MCSVYSAVSGEKLAVLDQYDGKNAKEMKQSLTTQIGVPRFRQRFLSEDGSQEIPDDEVFTAQPVKVQLVCSEFKPPEFQEDQWMVSACRDNDLVALEILLKCPLNPNFTDVNGNRLLHHAAANGDIQAMKLLLEAGASKDEEGAEGNTPLHSSQLEMATWK